MNTWIPGLSLPRKLAPTPPIHHKWDDTYWKHSRELCELTAGWWSNHYPCSVRVNADGTPYKEDTRGDVQR